MRDEVMAVLLEYLDHRIVVEPTQNEQDVPVLELADEILIALGANNPELQPTELIRSMIKKGHKVSRRFVLACHKGQIKTEPEAIQFLKERR